MSKFINLAEIDLAILKREGILEFVSFKEILICRVVTDLHTDK